MAVRGQIAKNYIGNKIIEIFKRDFIKVEDKKIYLLADDGDNGKVQIAISMTCPKEQENINCANDVRERTRQNDCEPEFLLRYQKRASPISIC